MRFQLDGDPTTPLGTLLTPEADWLHRWLEAWISGQPYADRADLRPGAY